jgi:hypothetical protein
MPDRLLRKPWFIRWVIPLTGILMACSFIFASYAIQRQQDDSARTGRALCHAINLNRAAMRQIIRDSIRLVEQYVPDPGLQKAELAVLHHDLVIAGPIDCQLLLNP